ncbi:MAG: DUF59 domain-containing protein [Candidatus Puniceispirillaceae bacterium]
MSAKDSIFDENGPGLADFLPDTSSGYTAYAGESLKECAPADKADIIEALKTVKDPEIPVNIYDLGLVYTIDCAPSGDVHIEMSLTAPGCPVAGEMPQQVANAVAALATAGRVSVTLVWDPAWTPERMSEDAKLALDFGF